MGLCFNAHRAHGSCQTRLDAPGHCSAGSRPHVAADRPRENTDVGQRDNGLDRGGCRPAPPTSQPSSGSHNPPSRSSRESLQAGVSSTDVCADPVSALTPAPPIHHHRSLMTFIRENEHSSTAGPFDQTARSNTPDRLSRDCLRGVDQSSSALSCTGARSVGVTPLIPSRCMPSVLGAAGARSRIASACACRL